MEYSQASGGRQEKALGPQRFDEDRKQALYAARGNRGQRQLQTFVSSGHAHLRAGALASLLLRVSVLPACLLLGRVSWILLQLVKGLPFTLRVSR